MNEYEWIVSSLKDLSQDVSAMRRDFAEALADLRKGREGAEQRVASEVHRWQLYTLALALAAGANLFGVIARAVGAL